MCVFLTEGGAGRIRYASVYRGKKLQVIIIKDVQGGPKNWHNFMVRLNFTKY